MINVTICVLNSALFLAQKAIKEGIPALSYLSLNIRR